MHTRWAFFLMLSLLSVTCAYGADDDLNKTYTELTGADPALRVSAARMFLKTLAEPIKAAKKDYLRQLDASVNGPDVAARDNAAQSLSKILQDLRKSNDQAIGALITACTGGGPVAREAACKQLAELLNHACENAYFDALLDDLASTNPATVASAAKRLTELGSDAAPTLANGLDDERLAVKTKAAEILKALGPAAKDVASDIAFLLDSDDKATRRLSLSVLESLGPNAAGAVDQLLTYLEHDEKSVRRSAVTLLKRLGPAAKDAASDLAGMLDNEDKSVRAVATDILVNMGPAAKDAAEDLGDMVADAKNDADQRERAANVLAAIGPAAADKALEQLKKAANAPEPTVKAAVELAIKKLEQK